MCETRQATIDIVTTGFFETLGVQPVYGRDFTMDEERPGTPARSAIVSYKVWDDIDETLERLRKRGAQLVGEVVRYEDAYRLCYIRGPEGLLIGLAQELG